MTPEPNIVVFDTNVLIPLITAASRSARLFLRLQKAGYDVAASPQIVQEVRDKMMNKQPLRDWMSVTDEEIEVFLNRLPNICRRVPGRRHVHGAVPADPKDDKIIAAALEAGASYIISEDKHLLDLSQRAQAMC
jgi:putative PIN family toxin of toxin-antitoxin system